MKLADDRVEEYVRIATTLIQAAGDDCMTDVEFRFEPADEKRSTVVRVARCEAPGCERLHVVVQHGQHFDVPEQDDDGG